MGCLHDPANVHQTSSKCIQNTRANAGRLLDRLPIRLSAVAAVGCGVIYSNDVSVGQWLSCLVAVSSSKALCRMVKYPKIRSCSLDLWPVTSKYNTMLAVVEIQVCEKCH